MNSGGRFLPLSTVEEYVVRGVNGVFEVRGTPPMTISIDPDARVLALRTPAGERMANVGALQRVQCRDVLDGATLQHTVEIAFDEDLDEIYALLCTVADRVQLNGEAFADAIEASLDALVALLQRRPTPSVEQQVGLIGELLTLLALAAQGDISYALECWRGPRGEEHDFGTNDFDLEVKTTLSEQRSHWISSDTQLLPTGDRPLYLLSFQLTRAAAGRGWTLPALVDRVRALVRTPQPLTDLFEGTIYSDRVRDLMTERWTMRTMPATFEVTTAFPAVTRPRLAQAIPQADHIVDFRYRVDLTGLPQTFGLLDFSSVAQPGE